MTETTQPAEHDFKTYEQFWSHYLDEHSRAATKWLHAAGTVTAVILIILFAATHRWLFIPLALIPGYGLSWIGHYFVERNTPATFGHPLWSMLSDFKMVALMLTGQLREK
jgi:hypothetical protein